MQYCKYKTAKILSLFFLFVNILLLLNRSTVLIGLLLYTGLTSSEMITDSRELLVAGDTLTSDTGQQLTWQIIIAQHNKTLPASLPYHIQLQKGASLWICTDAELPEVNHGQLTISSLTVVGVNALSEFKAESDNDNDFATAMVSVPPPGLCSWQEGTDFTGGRSRLFSGKDGFFVASYSPETGTTGSDAHDPYSTDVTRNDSLSGTPGDLFGQSNDSDSSVSSGGDSGELPFDFFGKKPGFYPRPGSDHQGHFILDLLPAHWTSWILGTPDSDVYDVSENVASSPATNWIRVSFNPGNGQEPVDFYISPEELNFLLRYDETSSSLINVKRLIPWLRSQLSGRQDFIDQVLNILESEAQGGKSNFLSQEQHEEIQKLIRLALEQPDQHFYLNFELTELLSVFTGLSPNGQNSSQVNGKVSHGGSSSTGKRKGTGKKKSTKNSAMVQPNTKGTGKEGLSDDTGQGSSGGDQSNPDKLTGSEQPVDNFNSLYDMAMKTITKHGDRTAYSHRPSSGVSYVNTSYRDWGTKIATYQKEFKKRDLKKGDRIALFLKPSSDWSAFFYAANGLGISVVVTDLSAKDQWIHYIRDSKPTLCIMKDDQQKNELRKRLNHHRELKETNLVTVSKLNDTPLDNSDSIQEKTALSVDDEAIIFRTSDTTGKPKWVVHTNGSILAMVKSMMGHHKFKDLGERSDPVVYASLLPWDHIFSIVGEMALSVRVGASVSFIFDAEKTLVDDLAAIKPHILMTEPDILEKIYKDEQRRYEYASFDQTLFYNVASFLSNLRISYTGYQVEAVRPTWRIPLLIDRLVYGPVRGILGGRLEMAITSGSPVAHEVSDFYRQAGLTIIETYGTPEAGIITMNGYHGRDDFKQYSVGSVVDGVRLVQNHSGNSVSGDFEMIVYGPGVMKEYLNEAEATKQVIVSHSKHGRGCRTGDLGAVTHGHLKISGRLSNMITLADDRYISPESAEALMNQIPWVEHAVLLANKNKTATHVILNIYENSGTFKGIALGRVNSDSKLKEELLAKVLEQLDHPDISDDARPKSIEIEMRLWNQFNFLTSTLKVNRDAVKKDFARRTY